MPPARKNKSFQQIFNESIAAVRALYSRTDCEIEKAIITGVMEFWDLGLDGRPAIDRLGKTIIAWVKVCKLDGRPATGERTRPWQNDDIPEIRHAFLLTSRHAIKWPSPALFFTHVKKTDLPPEQELEINDDQTPEQIARTKEIKTLARELAKKDGKEFTGKNEMIYCMKAARKLIESENKSNGEKTIAIKKISAKSNTPPAGQDDNDKQLKTISSIFSPP